MRTLTEGLPLVGALFESVHRFTDAMTGTAETVRVNAMGLHRAEALAPLETQVGQKLLSGQAEVDDARARADVLEGFHPAPMEAFDRTTIQGDLAARQYAQRLPLQDARDRALAEVDVAQRQAEAAGRRQEEVAARAAAAEAKVNSARGALEASKAAQNAGGWSLSWGVRGLANLIPGVGATAGLVAE